MFAVIYSCQKEQQTVVVGPFRSDLPIMIRQVSLHAALACKQGSVAHIVVAADLLAIAVPPVSFIGRDDECAIRAKVHSPSNRAALFRQGHLR